MGEVLVRRPQDLTARWAQRIVDLRAPGTAVTNVIIISNTGLSTTTVDGAGGGITITATDLHIDKLLDIKADTSGTGNAGDIRLQVGTLTATNALISSSSTATGLGTGNAGTITIEGLTLGTPAQTVTLSDTTLETTLAGSGAGGTGDITITATTLDLGGEIGLKVIERIIIDARNPDGHDQLPAWASEDGTNVSKELN